MLPADFKQLIGQPDTSIVWVALIDSAEPFEIRTSPSDRHLIRPIGLRCGGLRQNGGFRRRALYIPFEFEIVYNTTSRRPRYILVTASASKYGDCFTGGNGSTPISR